MLSLANLQTGNTEEALKILKDAENIFPGEYEILFHIAKVYEEMKQDDKAEEYYKMSFELTPEEYDEARSDCMNDLGAMKYFQGKEDEAIECWEKALEINPGNVNAKSNLYGIPYDEIEEDEGFEEDEDDDIDEEDFDGDNEEFKEFEKDIIGKLEEYFELFQNTQQGIYFKKQNRNSFISEGEEDKVNSHIRAEWVKSFAGKMDRMESLNEDQRSEWFNSVEIDFEGPVPEIDLPEYDNPMYTEMSKKLSFLPPNGLSYLMLAFPFLDEVGITMENLAAVVNNTDVNEEDKLAFIWACGLGERIFRLSGSISENEFQKGFEGIITAASEKVTRKKAKKILIKIIEEMSKGI